MVAAILHLIVVEHRRHETRAPVPWILGVDRVAEVQDEKVAYSRRVLENRKGSEKRQDLQGGWIRHAETFLPVERGQGRLGYAMMSLGGQSNDLDVFLHPKVMI